MMANLLRITCGKTILLTASLLWITHAFSFTHAQTTWVVCDTCAISSIQAGIDSASVGDTIFVEAGTYTEDIILDKENIKLFGPNHSIPGYDSINRLPEAIINERIRLGDNVGSGSPANGSEFKGFTVLDPGSIQTGIGSNSHDILVENNIVQGYTTGFTNALASGNVMEKTMIVRHNLFIGHVSAISTEGAHTAIIENNHFLNNRNSIGFNDNDTDSFSIQDNVFIIDNVDSLEMEFSNDARYISVRGALAGPPAEDVLNNNNNMFSPSARFLLSGNNTSHIVPEGSGSIFPVEIIRNGVAVDGFNAIQDAVDGAMAGDTIQVAPGTYEENVHIQTNDLTIISTDGAGSTSIVESGDGTMGVVAIEANGVSLIGFTIDAQVNGSNNRGVRVNRSTDGVLIKENVFNDAQLGVQGDWGSGSASNLTISENIFNSKVGIGGTEDIENLTIVNNIFNTSIEGIKIGDGVVLSGIGIQNNSFEVDSGVAIANFKMNPIAAPCNWFGTNDIDSIEMHLVTGSGTVYVRPYLIDGTDTQPAQTGFFPDADNCQNPDVVFNTTQNTSFSSIQTAINLANPGDVIQVGTGTFFENIVIDKEGLTLVNGSWPVIDGNEGVPVHITANNVTLKGFKVTNAAPDSALIWIDNVTGVTIDSNYLTNPGTVSLYGIAIDGGGEHTIVQNEIDSVAYGVAMQLSTSNQVGQSGLGNEINAVAHPTDSVVIPTGVLLFDASNENTIGYNQIHSVRYGVHLADESENNSIGSNIVAGQDHGIIFRTFNFPTPAAYSAQNNQILENEIIATDSSFKYGIKLQDSASMNIVAGNNIHSGWGGIWVEESSDISIVNNFITTTEFGIRLRNDAENVNINDNSITGQSDAGLENDSGNLTDATCNWWGSASLSDVEDALDTTDVDFAPYLYSGVDDDGNVSTGFQPEPMACVFQLECPQDTTLVGSSAPDCDIFVGGLIAFTNDPDAVITNNYNAGGEDASDTFDFGVTIIEFEAVSAIDDTLNCSVTVTVEEELSLNCVAADTIYLDGSCEALLPDYTDSLFAEVINGCDSDYTLTQNISAGDSLTAAGFIQIEVVAENATFGNSDTCHIEVAVLDSIAPEIQCLFTSTTRLLDANCEATIPNYDSEGFFYNFTENCDTAFTFSQSMTPGDTISGVVNIDIMLIISDQSGNSSSCITTLITEDNTPPTVTCPATTDTVFVDQNCEAEVPDYAAQTGVMDNCSPPSVDQLPMPGETLGLGLHTVRIDIEDDGGNTDSCFVEVTVLDNTAPMVTCTSTVTITLDSTCQAEVPDFSTTGDVSFSDNCEADTNLIYVQSPITGDFFVGVGMDTVEITVTDSSGNSASCQLYIDLIDETNPEISCIDSTIAVSLDSACQYIVQDFTGNAIVSDNCDTAVVVSQSILEGDTLSGVSTHTVVLTAEDASSNSATCSFTLDLEDNTPPVIDCPSALDTIYVDMNCVAAVPDYISSLVVTDNCGVDTVYQSPEAGSQISTGTHTITIEAEDESGNASSCTVSLSVLDTIPPVVSCDSDTLYLGPTCEVALPDYLSEATVMDNCDSTFTTDQIPAMGTIIDSAGIYNVNLSFTDQSGNTGSCVVEVIAIDTIPPSIDCPGTVNQFLNADCEAELGDFTGWMTPTDNCSGPLTVTQNPSPGFTIFGEGSQTVFLEVEDGSGNTAECSFTVTTTDTIPPVVSCPPAFDTIYKDAVCLAYVPNYVDETAASDSCGIMSVTQDSAIGAEIDLGTHLITVTAEDVNGNTSTCEIELTVLDTIPPVVTCEDEVVYLDENCSTELPDFSGELDISDNCDTAFSTVQYPAPGTPLDSTGTLSVTMTVTDSSGNSTECEISVELVDTIGPSISCMGTFTMYLDQNCEAILPAFSPSVTTLNCDTNPVLTQSVPAGATFTSPTSFNVILTIEDEYGNTDNCTIGVEIKDTTSPVIACLIASDTVYVDASCEAPVPDFASDTSVVQATDNCDTPSISQLPEAGDLLGPGVYTVEFSAEDSSGNESSCSIELVVLDTIAPQLTCPEGPFEIVLDDIDCEATLTDFLAHEGLMVSDNCDDSLQLVQTPAAGHLLTAPGPLTVEIEATDSSGNSATCVIDVNVVDEVAPVILCPVSITMPIFGDCESFMPLLTHTPYIMDNCDTAFTVTQTPPGFTPVMGTQPALVEITVTDMSGNSATCEVNVFFDDQEAPVVECPPATDTILVANNCVAFVPDYLDGLQVDDNCGIDTVYQTPEAGASVSVGDHLVTIVVEDVNGNSSSCEVELTVEDDMDPVVTDCQDMTIYLDEYCTAEIPSLESQAGSVSDNCTSEGDFVFDQSVEHGTIIDAPDTVSVVLYFTDESGNTGSCEIAVFAVDTISPTLNCTTSIVLYLDENEEVTLGNLESLVDAMDNCNGVPVVTQDPEPNTVYTSAGMEFVTMTATDASGNFTECTIGVEIRDTLCPGLSCPFTTDTIYVASNNCLASVPDYSLIVDTSTDCEPVEVTQSLEAGDLVGPGNYPITITATDTLGNTAQCEISLVVIDDTPPIVECPSSSETIFLDENCTVELPDYIAESNISDNCGPEGLNIQQDPPVGTEFSGHQIISVVVSASDVSGNFASCTMEVNITDNQPPTIECPSTLSVAVDSECEAQVPDLTDYATIEDNCDDNLTTNQTPSAGSTVSGTDDVTVSLVVTDGGNNTASCTVTLELTDDLAPVFVNCPPDYSYTISTASCEGIVDVDELIATDNCTAVNITNDYNDGGADASGIYPLGTTEVLFTATDQNGNSATCSLSVVVEDNTPPVVTHCPSDVTVNCGQPTDPYFTGGLAQGENPCNGDVSVSYSDDVDGEYCEDRVITRTFVLTDDFGNENSSCVQTVTVANDAGPVVVNCPDDMEINLDPDSCETTVELVEEIEAYNSCYHESFEFSNYSPGQYPAVPSLSFNQNQSDLVRIRGFFFTPFPNPGNISPYPATHGNFHGIIKSGDVDDSDSGVFSRLGGHSTLFGGGFEVSIDAYIELNDPAVAANTYGWDLGTGVNDQDGDLLRNYYFHVASNTSGQVLIGSSNATDGTRKTDISSGNHAVVSGSRWLRFIWTFDDNGDDTMLATLKVTRLNGTVIYTETYNEAGDLISSVVGGNRDMSFPFLEVDDLSIDNIRLKYFPVATSCDLAGLQTLGVGQHDITCVAEDACGNETECTYTVTVIGDDELTLDCPSEVNAEANENECFAMVNLEAVFTAGCDDDVTVENSFNNGGADASGNYPIGTTTVVFDAVASGGETASCTTVVEVTGDDPDGIAIMCPSGQTVDAEAGLCEASISLDSAVAMFGCDVDETLSIENDFNSGGPDASDVYPVGVNIVTFSVTDGSAVFATCSVSLEVVDTEAPTADCSDIISLDLDSDGEASIQSAQLESMFDDNCSVEEVSASPSTFDCGDIGTNPVVLTAEDASGNQSTCTIIVTVSDNMAPELSCPAEINTDVDEGECFATGSLVASASDNCDLDQISNTFNSGGLNASGQYDPGTTTVVFSASDGEGNTAQCTTIVNVSGTTGPGFELHCPSDTVFTNDPGDCTAFVNLPEATITEGCGFDGPVTITNNYSSGGGADASDVYDVGITNVIFTAIDNSGNTADCNTLVTVNDIEPPVANCSDITLELSSSDQATLETSDYELMFTDNCGIEFDSLSASKTEFDCDSIGYNRVTLSATDVNGNSSSCNIWVNVMLGESSCEPITLKLDTVSASPGEVICLPVRVENFVDVAGIQGTVVSGDTNVFQITGANNIALSPGLFSYNVSGSNGEALTYSWFNAVGIDIADGEESFCVEIQITGEVGDTADISFSNDPAILEVTTTPGGANPESTNALHLNGQVIIVPDTGGIAGLQGGIWTDYDMPVGDVAINVNGIGSRAVGAISDVNGFYQLDLPQGFAAEITPEKGGDYLEGVSTFDIIQIHRHLLQLEMLSSPYKIIAADVNGDDQISTLDLVLLQANLVGNKTGFGDNASWRFVPADFEFPNPANPFETIFPESRWYEGLNGIWAAEDWTAIKVGDVNETLNPFNTAEERSARPQYPLTVRDGENLGNGVWMLPVYVSELDGLGGFQFSVPVVYGRDRIVGIDWSESDLAGSGTFDHRLDKSSEVLNVSWYNGQGVDVDGQTLAFHLMVESQNNSIGSFEDLSFDFAGLYPEAYDLSGRLYDLTVETEISGFKSEGVFELFQNRPNPFNEQTLIEYQLPQEEEVELTIYAQDGRLMRTIETTGYRGMNEILLNTEDLSSGIYYYRLNAGPFQGVKTMIKVD